jgi:hypothetical protein
VVRADQVGGVAMTALEGVWPQKNDRQLLEALDLVLTIMKTLASEPCMTSCDAAGSQSRRPQSLSTR